MASHRRNWLRPVFQYIPLESQIEKIQDGYYDAIAGCNAKGNSTAFIEFMLARLSEALDEVLQQSNLNGGNSEYVSRLLDAIMFSLIETAKESGLDPFKYLTYVFRTAPVISGNNKDRASVLTPAEVKPLIE